MIRPAGGGGRGGAEGNRPRDPWDEGFPLGEGRAQDQARSFCPYCGEKVVVLLDPGSGPRQIYVEDCPVCCRPWRVDVRYGYDGKASVALTAEDDAFGEG